MFGSRYFGARYFGPRYFGRNGSVAFPGLIEALNAFLAADPQVLAAFPGGVANDHADRDTAYPFLALVKSKTTRQKTFRPGYSIERVTVHFVAVAPGAEAAEAAARVVRARVLPSTGYTPQALSFTDGIEPAPEGRFIPEEGEGESVVLDPTLGYQNADVYRAVLPVVFRVARGG